MNFLEKLISDTKNGGLDFVWKYTEGGDGSYTFVIPKHYLNGMKISTLDKKSGIVIFPNGYMWTYHREIINKLINVIEESMERTTNISANQYTSESVVAPDPTQAQETNNSNDESNVSLN